MDGNDWISLLRARHSLRTRPSSYDSRYLMPPQARLDDCCEVTEPKSPRSISATFAPRAASAAADTAPLMPPPRTSTSNRCSASRRMLVSRSLRYGMGRRYTGGMLAAAACALLSAAEIQRVQGES